MEIVKLNDIELELPDLEDLKKWDYGIDQGNKLIWLDEYIRDFKLCKVERHSHLLRKNSRGNVFLDDIRVKENNEGSKIFEIFGKLYQK